MDFDCFRCRTSPMFGDFRLHFAKPSLLIGQHFGLYPYLETKLWAIPKCISVYFSTREIEQIQQICREKVIFYQEKQWLIAIRQFRRTANTPIKVCTAKSRDVKPNFTQKMTLQNNFETKIKLKW